jgi:ornithine cyclodeaminase/alanine dehydrogenase-like protein (mu-crystallin family)
LINPPLLITRQEVNQLLDWPVVVDATRKGLIAEGSAADASSVSTQVLYGLGSLHLKAASLESEKILSVKANLRPNHGGVSGVLLAYDLATQRLAGIIDAGLMTARRTGAIAAVAASCLNGVKPVRVGVLGAGPVGIECAQGLLRELDVAELRIWSANFTNAQRAALTLTASTDAVIIPCQTVSDATSGTNIVITATPASTPILTNEGLESNVLILAMGADSVGKREISLEVLQNSDVVADVPDDALRVGESAYLDPERKSHVIPISQLLASSTHLERSRRHLLFDSVGSSYVDAAITSVIMTRALSMGLGRELHLSD